MANNKVQLADGTVLIDLTDTTATPPHVEAGIIFLDAAGVRREGELVTYSITQALTLVTSSADDTKVIAGNSFFTELVPDDGYVISSITVTMGGVDITDQVFKPAAGVKTITANGTYNAADDGMGGYSTVIVNVEGRPTYSITQNLTDVSSTSVNGEVLAGGSLYIELEPTIEGYAISEITVTMGGVDITDQVFKSGGN